MNCIDELLSRLDGGRVLDAGCGSGEFTRVLADRLRSFTSITGIDPNKDSLDEARRQTEDRRITYRQTGILDIDPEPPRFNTAAIANALHHVPEAELSLARLFAVLEPGGTIIVNELIREVSLPAQENGRRVHHFKARVDTLRGMSHRETYTSDEIRAMVRGVGIVDVRECFLEPEPQEEYGEKVAEVMVFMRDYLEFVKDTDEYSSLLAELESLDASIREHGVQSAPMLLIVGQKPSVN